MSEKSSVLARVPKDVLKDLRIRMPDANDATRFRMLYNSSLFRAEKVLADKKFTDTLGTFVYGGMWQKANKNVKKTK